jgi:chromosome segregation protein
VKRLLGHTWLVDRLSTALRLSQSSGRGLEFVTSDGELLTSDGTLVIGPRLAAAGIMSRRSELRACNEQVAVLETQLTHSTVARARLEHQCAQHEAFLASSVAAYAELADKLADCRQLSATNRAQLERVTRECERVEAELRTAEERIAALGSEMDAVNSQRANAEAAAEQLQARFDILGEDLAKRREQHARLQAEAIEQQVAAAKCEQRVEMLRQQMSAAQRNRQERDRAMSDARARLQVQQNQLTELDHSMLLHRQALADLFLLKEQYMHELTQQVVSVDELRHDRNRLAEHVRNQRQQLTSLQTQQHKLEVAINRRRHELQTLCERMQDDYGIDLAICAPSTAGQPHELAQPGASGQPGALTTGQRDPVTDVASQPAPFDRDAAEREIASLRDQLNHIGAVNLEALDELEQLESRFGQLSDQYRDLVEAKASLERITQRINADSRQLFLATLETVRGHFQELFRRLFGGGEADIVVDDAEDVLECGIEIVARPPGKEACSISLLSGGEKTLTCVALLLAVFRSKPSPFCVLDEVDAALDEANIGRFIAVLREFLSFTQFVVVTHSKKTMSGADTLYGVTMEESGVSKRVSVRFEDVSEDGQISTAALRRAA